ncbi:hypothetical protein [Streptomyces sp. NPDC059168]|uniref:hypothetical protein n=1 Tax=Streptomyces sp. NPDC059168 TaxID=3346753 RepID=UPI0036A1B194
MGVKPLFYYPLPGSGVLFGSEPKAILAHPQADRVVDADWPAGDLHHRPDPGLSLYKGLRAGQRHTVPHQVRRLGGQGAPGRDERGVRRRLLHRHRDHGCREGAPPAGHEQGDQLRLALRRRLGGRVPA